MRFLGRSKAARAQALAKRLRGIQAGTGRIAHALGARDPRHRRNDQSAQATNQRFGDEFTVDKNGRLRLKDGE